MKRLGLLLLLASCGDNYHYQKYDYNEQRRITVYDNSNTQVAELEGRCSIYEEMSYLKATCLTGENKYKNYNFGNYNNYYYYSNTYYYQNYYYHYYYWY